MSTHPLSAILQVSVLLTVVFALCAPGHAQVSAMNIKPFSPVAVDLSDKAVDALGLGKSVRQMDV
mgnify:CR=1 FL=1